MVLGETLTNDLAAGVDAPSTAHVPWRRSKVRHATVLPEQGRGVPQSVVTAAHDLAAIFDALGKGHRSARKRSAVADCSGLPNHRPGGKPIMDEAITHDLTAIVDGDRIATVRAGKSTEISHRTVLPKPGTTIQCGQVGLADSDHLAAVVDAGRPVEARAKRAQPTPMTAVFWSKRTLPAFAARRYPGSRANKKGEYPLFGGCGGQCRGSQVAIPGTARARRTRSKEPSTPR